MKKKASWIRERRTVMVKAANPPGGQSFKVLMSSAQIEFDYF